MTASVTQGSYFTPLLYYLEYTVKMTQMSYSSDLTALQLARKYFLQLKIIVFSRGKEQFSE